MFKVGDRVRLLTKEELLTVDPELLKGSTHSLVLYRDAGGFLTTENYVIKRIEGAEYPIVLCNSDYYEAVFSEYELETVPKFSIKGLYEV